MSENENFRPTRSDLTCPRYSQQHQRRAPTPKTFAIRSALKIGATSLSAFFVLFTGFCAASSASTQAAAQAIVLGTPASSQSTPASETTARTERDTPSSAQDDSPRCSTAAALLVAGLPRQAADLVDKVRQSSKVADTCKNVADRIRVELAAAAALLDDAQNSIDRLSAPPSEVKDVAAWKVKTWKSVKKNAEKASAIDSEDKRADALLTKLSKISDPWSPWRTWCQLHIRSVTHGWSQRTPMPSTSPEVTKTRLYALCVGPLDVPVVRQQRHHRAARPEQQLQIVERVGHQSREAPR